MVTHLAMICPTLVDMGGHEYDYTYAVADAAVQSGCDVATYIPHDAKNFTLPGRIIRNTPPHQLPKGKLARAHMLARICWGYGALFGKENRPTLWFIHSISQNQIILVIVAWLLARKMAHELVLFIRHKVGEGLSQRLLLWFSKIAVRHNVRFVADSFLIAEDVTARIGIPVSVAPIPVLLPTIPEKTHTKTCAYFGARRLQKGFALLPDMVRAAKNAAPELNFVIQAYAHRDDAANPQLDAALGALRQESHVEIIEEIVETARFNQMVASADLALIPYDAAVYNMGTSGNFVAAVVARSVVVVTGKTWMAKVAKRHNLTRVVPLPDQPTVAQINDVMQKAVSMLSAPDVPSEAERLWCHQQTATHLWQKIQGNK